MMTLGKTIIPFCFQFLYELRLKIIYYTQDTNTNRYYKKKKPDTYRHGEMYVGLFVIVKTCDDLKNVAYILYQVLSKLVSKTLYKLIYAKKLAQGIFMFKVVKIR